MWGAAERQAPPVPHSAPAERLLSSARSPAAAGGPGAPWGRTSSNKASSPAAESPSCASLSVQNVEERRKGGVCRQLRPECTYTPSRPSRASRRRRGALSADCQPMVVKQFPLAASQLNALSPALREQLFLCSLCTHFEAKSSIKPARARRGVVWALKHAASRRRRARSIMAGLREGGEMVEQESTG